MNGLDFRAFLSQKSMLRGQKLNFEMALRRKIVLQERYDGCWCGLLSFPSTLKVETSLLWYKTSVVYNLVFLVECFCVVCGPFLGPEILS